MTIDNIISLFKGVGVIIDENIDNADSRDDILKIYKYFIHKQIPILTYTSIPEDEIVLNFRNANFIVLDWNLHNQNPITSTTIDENIHFIEIVNSICFVPIFIFTNEGPHEIELTLQDRGLFYEDKSNNIFVKSKSEIRSGRILFSEIAKWVRKTKFKNIQEDLTEKVVFFKDEMELGVDILHLDMMTTVSKERNMFMQVQELKCLQN